MKPLALSVVAGVLLCATSGAGPIEVKSPNGQLVVTVGTRDFGEERACPVYRVAYKGREALADSRLGLQLEPTPLRAGLAVGNVTRATRDSTWRPVCGERAEVRDHFEEAVVEFVGADGAGRLPVTFRAYDEGVAFRYAVAGGEPFTIGAELTQFRFSGDHPAWAVYRAQGDYSGGTTPISQVKPGAERPLTVKVADDLYVAVTEAGLVDYARMKLRRAAEEPTTLEAFLDAERGVVGKVTGVAPFYAPWRVVMVAESPGKLLEQNYLVANLNEPCAIEDTSWIKPGKCIREVMLTTAAGKACVDFCVERGLQFVELDAGWYGPESDDRSDARAVDPKKADRLDVREVIRYGAERGIGVILYVNRRALERQMDELFPLYEQWGVKGVKFGFVNVGSQRWTSWVHEGIRKAAAHHLMVDVHDEFRSMGYSRTYPNLMTVEGILGNEAFPTPAHHAALPFTRYLTGPADYTPCWNSPKLKTTHAHQLALSTIYFSPWQFLFWYDRPGDVRAGDARALEYWKALPTCWDETRVVAGEIGKYASVARRKGEEWFVGSIRADGAGELEVPLKFLTVGKRYEATVYGDGEGLKEVRIEAMPVDSNTVLKARMGANGGQAVRIAPAQ